MRLVLICLLLLNLLALAAGFGLLGSSEPRGEAERLTNQINPERLRLEPVAPITSAAQPSTSSGGSAATASPTTPTSVLSRDTAQPLDTPSAAPATPVPTSPLPTSTPTPLAAPAIAPTGASRSTLADEPTDPPAETTPPGALLVEEVATETDDTTLVCVAYADLAESERDEIVAIAESVNPIPRITTEMIEPPASWWVRIPPTGSRNAAEERARQLRAQDITDLFIVREQGPNQYAISLGLFRTEASARQHLADLQARQVRGAEIAARNPASFALEITGTTGAIGRLNARLAQSGTNLQAGTCAQ